jgi:alpha-ketoglutarate-dependent taurine dioxygenase
MKVEPLDATLGARVTDVRLADLDDATWATIEAAFHEHGILVFPAQHLSDDEQRAFATRFGDLEVIVGEDGMTPIANIKRSGEVLAADNPVMSILRGNQGWHTDSSYMPVSAKASMLSARVVPSQGGRTEWCDMRAAYDALDDATKARIDGRSAAHSIVYSQRRAGEETFAGGYGYDVGVPPRRPLVKVHPATGRPALFIGRHAHDVSGLTAEESEALLDGLLDFACRPPRVYTHQWQVGDLVVWDNRCVLHRAQPWDWSEPRVMMHTRVSGDPVTETALV